MALRQYQKDTLNNIIRSQRKGNKNILLQAATGSGKTVMASAFVKHSINQNKNVLFLAHRRELITQCSDKLTEEGVRHGNPFHFHHDKHHTLKSRCAKDTGCHLKGWGKNRPYKKAVKHDEHKVDHAMKHMMKEVDHDFRKEMKDQ